MERGFREEHSLLLKVVYIRFCMKFVTCDSTRTQRKTDYLVADFLDETLRSVFLGKKISRVNAVDSKSVGECSFSCLPKGHDHDLALQRGSAVSSECS